jgi:hypothetical protein
MVDTGSRPGKRPKLFDLLREARNRAATRPEDYVFAIIALAVEFMHLEDNPSSSTLYNADFSRVIEYASSVLYPDYHKPVSKVFRDTTVFIVCLYRSLETLTEVKYIEDSPFPDCPSWTPIWSQPKNTRKLLHWESYNASLEEDISLSIQDERNLLRVQGFSFDMVNAVNEPLINTSSDDEFTYRDDATSQELTYVSSAWGLVEHYRRNGRIPDGVREQLGTLDNNRATEEFESPYKDAEGLLFAFISTLSANWVEDFAEDIDAVRRKQGLL